MGRPSNYGCFPTLGYIPFDSETRSVVQKLVREPPPSPASCRPNKATKNHKTYERHHDRFRPSKAKRRPRNPGRLNASQILLADQTPNAQAWEIYWHAQDNQTVPDFLSDRSICLTFSFGVGHIPHFSLNSKTIRLLSGLYVSISAPTHLGLWPTLTG